MLLKPKIKFFLDENMPYSTLKVFEECGFYAKHVKDTKLVGTTDEEIAKYARKENAILVTKDLQFGNILIYPKDYYRGLVIVHLPYNFTTSQISKTLSEFLKVIKIDDLENSITIVELGRYRLRKLK